MTRERDRYGRASLRERVAEIPEWFRTHRSITIVIAFLVGGMLLVRFLQPDYVAIADVRPGDCLYAREGFSGFVERGRCEVDHSHEVSGVFDLTPDQSTRDREAVVEEQRAACEDTFASYVGVPAGDSRFESLMVLSDPLTSQGGRIRVVCLIAAEDGRPFSGSARGAGS